MLLSTTDTIPGKTISKHLGLVRGNTIRARHVGRDIDRHVYVHIIMPIGHGIGSHPAKPAGAELMTSSMADPTITSYFEGGKKSWDGIDDRLSTMFDFPMQSTIREVVLRDRPADSLGC